MVNGGEKTKKYVFESTGSGVAIFDYDTTITPTYLSSTVRGLTYLPAVRVPRTTSTGTKVTQPSSTSQLRVAWPFRLGARCLRGRL